MGSADYGSTSQSYGNANLFAQADRNLTKDSDFLKTYGNTQTNSRTIESLQPDRSISRGASLGVNTNEASFFDFDPPSNTASPFQDQNHFGTPNGGAGGIPSWNIDPNFRPLSPPDSASPFSKDWNYGFQNIPPPSDILSTIQPHNHTRAQYGQVTPPDDEHDDDDSNLDYPPGEEQQQPTSPVTKKRKRDTTTSTKETSAPAKRTRKYTTRNTTLSNNKDHNKPEDVRRSKFLERNRVAASKCRQKKKEWTQNLENRGRELQKNSNNLRMMVDSLRQEVLFLKGEMLKHSGCDCAQIHDFLKSGACAMSTQQEDDALLKREPSPFESMPPSRLGSVGTVETDGASVVDEEILRSGQSNADIAGDEHALEALLTSSLNHDTSEKGVDSQIRGG